MKPDGGWLLPENIDPERKSFCISIPNDPNHIKAFFGNLHELALWFNWQRDDLHLATQAAQVWTEIEQSAWETFTEGGCMPPCDCPPMVRIGAQGQLQISDDGGATWTDASLPPYIPQPPRIGTSDRRCLAARNATEVYRLVYAEWQHIIDEQVEPLVILAAILSFIAALIIFAPALPALWEYFTSIFSAFEAISTSEWTIEVTEELTCIFYCNSRMDKGVVSFNYSGVIEDVGERALTLPIFAAIGYLLVIVGGNDGLTRAASTTSITDYTCTSLCSGCGGNWCAVVDFSEDIDNFTIVHGDLTFDGIETVATPVAYPFQSLGRQLILISVELPSDCEVCGCLNVEWTLQQTVNVDMGGYDLETGFYTNRLGALPGTPGDHTDIFNNNTCRAGWTTWYFYVATQSETIIARLNVLRIFGNGLNPFRDNSCQPLLG